MVTHTGMYYGRTARNFRSEPAVNRRLIRSGLLPAEVGLFSLKKHGASYTRRNIIADAFRRLGAYPQRLGAR